MNRRECCQISIEDSERTEDSGTETETDSRGEERRVDAKKIQSDRRKEVDGGVSNRKDDHGAASSNRVGRGGASRGMEKATCGAAEAGAGAAGSAKGAGGGGAKKGPGSRSLFSRIWRRAEVNEAGGDYATRPMRSPPPRVPNRRRCKSFSSVSPSSRTSSLSSPGNEADDEGQAGAEDSDLSTVGDASQVGHINDSSDVSDASDVNDRSDAALLAGAQAMALDISIDSRQELLETFSSTSLNCRICQLGSEDTDEELQRVPCNCKGSLQFAHKTCIEKWTKTQRSNKCEICKEPLSSEIPVNDDDEPHTWLDNMTHRMLVNMGVAAPQDQLTGAELNNIRTAVGRQIQKIFLSAAICLLTVGIVIVCYMVVMTSYITIGIPLLSVMVIVTLICKERLNTLLSLELNEP